MEAALKLLDRQAYSEYQLSVKLVKSGFAEEIAQEAIVRLKTWGYLDDRIFGENRIRLLQNRCKSREYIRYDLVENGLDALLIDELLKRDYPPDLELAIARKLLGKRFGARRQSPTGDTKMATDPVKASAKASAKASLKAAASLARAGFTEETICSCFPEGIPAISST